MKAYHQSIDFITMRLKEHTNIRLKVHAIGASLKRDALGVAGGLYSMNAPYAIGYLFNPNGNNKKVYSGTFCNYWNEIDLSYTYFFNYHDMQFYKILEGGK